MPVYPGPPCQTVDHHWFWPFTQYKTYSTHPAEQPLNRSQITSNLACGRPSWKDSMSHRMGCNVQMIEPNKGMQWCPTSRSTNITYGNPFKKSSSGCHPQVEWALTPWVKVRPLLLYASVTASIVQWDSLCFYNALPLPGLANWTSNSSVAQTPLSYNLQEWPWENMQHLGAIQPWGHQERTVCKKDAQTEHPRTQLTMGFSQRTPFKKTWQGDVHLV